MSLLQTVSATSHQALNLGQKHMHLLKLDKANEKESLCTIGPNLSWKIDPLNDHLIIIHLFGPNNKVLEVEEYVQEKNSFLLAMQRLEERHGVWLLDKGLTTF